MSSSPRVADGACRNGQVLADLTEDALLARIVPLMAGGRTEVLGPGDDAAVLGIDGPVVATTDAMVSGRDWRDDWSTPRQVAAKAVTQNLADIAAMGASPASLLITLVADPQTPLDWVVDFAEAMGGQCRRYGVSAAGGDLSSAGPGVRMVSITALGALEGREPVTRAGARPGDTVAVTGSLGRSAVGLALLQAADAEGRGPADLPRAALAHHLEPSCPLAQGPAAAAAGAGAMLDISDGLGRDGHRIARASGIRLELESQMLAADLNWAENYLPRAQARECVLGGGEEHSLLATFPGELPPFWRPLGRIVAGEPAVLLDGRAVDAAAGWDHFHR